MKAGSGTTTSAGEPPPDVSPSEGRRPVEPEALPLQYRRSPIAKEPISVVLVASADRTDHDQVVKAWTEHLDRREQDYEILLVVPEGAARTAESGALHLPRARLLPSAPSGLGAALRTGLQAARHPLVFYTTGDGRYLPADLELLFKWIDKVDMVTGYRVAPDGRRQTGWADRLFRWYVRLLFGVRLTDVGCLFLLARRDIFSRIPIQSDGAFAHAEIVAKANFLGCLISEMPVTDRATAAAPTLGGGSWAQVLHESRVVFSHPVFGLPAAGSPGQTGQPQQHSAGAGPPHSPPG